jgi:hypothetical protein
MDDIPGSLADLLHEYGEEWQIGQDGETGLWSAVAYPTPSSLRVLIGRTLGELKARLDKASGVPGAPAAGS